MAEFESKKDKITNVFIQKVENIKAVIGYFDYDVIELDDGTRAAEIEDPSMEFLRKMQVNEIEEQFSVILDHEEGRTYIIDA